MPSNDDRGDAPTSALMPETVLVRAREVMVKLSDEDEIGIDLHGDRFFAPRVALSLLDAFATPRTVGDVLSTLATLGNERQREARSCIDHLARSGVLVAPAERAALGTRGWVKPAIHLVMLDDRARTSGFCHALRSTVLPDDVVVDIGTGTGVLATCAALAGARRVFAVESSGIAEVAARVFDANGVRERVTLVRERSTTASLPERGTLLVTETIGNDPLDEQLLEIVDDAKRRLLAPGARIIPSAIEIYGIAVDIPRTVLERHVFTRRKVDGYTAAYGIDFSPLEEHRLSCSEPIMVDNRDVGTWPLSPPVRLASIDLTQPFETVIATRATAQISRDSQYLGVMLAFRATLAPGVVLSTLPDDFDPTSHWAHALFPAFDHPSVRGGTTITLDYSYDRGVTTLRVFPE
jgi:protein arginine N-methyltransferase 1